MSVWDSRAKQCSAQASAGPAARPRDPAGIGGRAGSPGAKRKGSLSGREGSDSCLHLHPGRASRGSSHLRDSARKSTTGRLRLGLRRRSAPRSHLVLGLLSHMAPVSSLPSPRKPPLYPLQPAGKWRHRSVGRMKGSRGGEGRAGGSCLGNPLCSDLLAGSQMLSPAYGGNVRPAGRWGVVHGPDHPLCPSAPVSASTDRAPQGQGQGPACLCPEAQPLELFHPAKM